MKKSIFILAFMLTSAFSFAGNEAVAIENVKSTKITESVATKCYRKAVDDFGNVYYVRVKCPKTIILE